jgi:hypothetical protein
MSLESDYNEIIRGMSAGAAQENENAVTSGAMPAGGVRWGLHRWQCDERPYIKVSCSRCKSTYMTGDLNFVFKHCGVAEAMPAELRDRLEALQLKLGIRVRTFVDGILGNSRSAPTPPNLNAF